MSPWHVHAETVVRAPTMAAMQTPDSGSSSERISNLQKLLRDVNVASKLDAATLDKLSSPDSGSDSDDEHPRRRSDSERHLITPGSGGDDVGHSTLSPGSTSTSALSLPSFMLHPDDSSDSEYALRGVRGEVTPGSDVSGKLPLGRPRSPHKRSRNGSSAEMYVQRGTGLLWIQRARFVTPVDSLCDSFLFCLLSLSRNCFSAKLQARVRQLEEAVDSADHDRRMAQMDQVQLRAQFERALAVQKVRVQREECVPCLAVAWFDVEPRTHATPHFALQEQFDAELNAASNEAATALGEATDLRNQLASTKELYRDLAVSEAHYEELKRIPEENMSLRQFVVVRVRELLAPRDADVERLRRDLTATRESMTANIEKLDREKRELLHRFDATPPWRVVVGHSLFLFSRFCLFVCSAFCFLL